FGSLQGLFHFLVLWHLPNWEPCFLKRGASIFFSGKPTVILLLIYMVGGALLLSIQLPLLLSRLCVQRMQEILFIFPVLTMPRSIPSSCIFPLSAIFYHWKILE